MPWPLSQDYNEAIQCPRDNFSDAELKTGEAVSNALGIPMPRSGNFADVYEVRCPSGSRWAVKCFTREVFGLSERYAEISKYLRLAHLPFMVDFQFLERGIRVRGQWYPLLKMQWVEGFLLNEFVRDNLDKKPILQALGQIWLRMAKRLRESYIAHCDLQHGNVLFVPGPTANSLAVKLIDYDGMCVPSLAGTKSGEVGHPAYQHPERLRSGAYNQEVDRFSLLSITTALHGLTIGGRSLWERYDNGDNLLFRQSDFQSPAQSPLFRELLTITDPQAHTLVTELYRACQGLLDAVPLLTDLLPESQASAASKSSATMKRTTVVKTATSQASPTADTTATDSAWDFEGEDKPLSRRRRKGGMLRWVVGVGLAAMVLAGGIVGWSIWSESNKPKDTPKIAQNNPPVKPLTQKGQSHKQPDSKEEQPEEDPPTNDDPVVPPSPEPKPSKPQGADDIPKPMARFPIHKETVGPWRIDNDLNAVVVDHPPGRGPWPNIYFGDRDWSDYDFAVDVNRLAGPSHCALWLRHTTWGNAYCVSLGKGSKFATWEIARNNRYAIEHRQVPLIENGRWYALRVVVRGSRIRIYVDDELMFDKQDETHPNGFVGLHVNSAKFAFRNIKVTDPDGKVLLQGLPELPSEKGEAKPEVVEEENKNASPESPKPTAAEDFVPLFNGKDTSGWKPQPGDKGKWEVKDGMLIGSGGSGRLLSERGHYENFRLRVEAMINHGGKSGLFFRAQFDPKAPKVYEAFINSSHKDPLKTGSLYGIASVTDHLHEPDEWFTLEVIAESGHIVIKVNDKKVVDKLDNRYRKGHFALQLYDAATVLKIRKIEVKELPASESAAMAESRPAGEKSFLPLFNGKDMKGWKTHPSQPGNWRVIKGVLIGSGPAVSHLYSNRGNYKDFHLRVEARINDGGNSGVYFRVPFGPVQPPNKPLFPLGYEAQINASSRDPRKTGSLIGMVQVSKSPHRPNEWFTQEVIVQGSHIVIKVNDDTTADYTDDKRLSARGHIALQQLDAATVVEFRKIEIKELRR